MFRSIADAAAKATRAEEAATVATLEATETDGATSGRFIVKKGPAGWELRELRVRLPDSSCSEQGER
jgi:hypothetical protein